MKLLNINSMVYLCNMNTAAQQINRIVKFFDRSKSTAWSRELGRRAEALNLGRALRRCGRSLPVGHGLCPEGAQSSTGNQMTLEVEGVVGGGMHRDEALSLSC
jgi:hypothetical protein